jgi:hypothetical protein
MVALLLLALFDQRTMVVSKIGHNAIAFTTGEVETI